MTNMLQVRDLHVTFVTPDRTVHAVNGVSFDLARGETLGILGESGSGKSVTLRSILRLHPEHRTRWSGSIKLEGDEILDMAPKALSDLRGQRVSMIFQEPATAFDPVFTIGQQIAETVVRHEGSSRAAGMARALELLELVQIPSAKRRLDAYPHELSGGQNQRVMIAIALAGQPELLVADEPTTALDVTIQAQILELLQALRRETGMALVLISHDLGVVAEACERVSVMYPGRIVEDAPIARLFDAAAHPYTQGLLGALPPIDGPRRRLAAIPGGVPEPWAMPPGCAFAPRCPHRAAACDAGVPRSSPLADGHRAACILVAPAATMAERMPA
jgi:peptide/nickel transport system ATP-binding protein